MKRSVRQKGIVETYKNRAGQDKQSGTIMQGGSECILFCRRVNHNIFDIKDGFAVVDGVEHCFNDGVCMVANVAKVVFILDPTEENSFRE